MLKRAAFVLMLGLGSPIALGAELRPLQEVLSTETSDAMTFYALKRCSAIYIPIQAMFLADGQEQSTQLAERASALSTRFFQAAMRVGKTAGMEVTADGVTADIIAIAEMYGDEMRSNYLASGNRMEGVVRQDLPICKAIGVQ